MRGKKGCTQAPSWQVTGEKSPAFWTQGEEARGRARKGSGAAVWPACPGGGAGGRKAGHTEGGTGSSSRRLGHWLPGGAERLMSPPVRSQGWVQAPQWVPDSAPGLNATFLQCLSL